MKRLILSLVTVLCVIVFTEDYLLERSKASVLQENTNETKAFRQQLLSEELLETLKKESRGDRICFSRLLTNLMTNRNFQGNQPFKVSDFYEDTVYMKYKKEEYSNLLESYLAVWADIEYFPVGSWNTGFSDSWEEPRLYGGNRIHEGTDIFGEKDIAGYYPVVSMTDGVVEEVGWLPLGGYRIGIRSLHGGYFYYAHLSSYDREFQKKDAIKAGEILGFMGNTGYGTKGTSGKFPVHLHMGIYIATEHYRELAVNPYWILMETKNRRIAYVN